MLNGRCALFVKVCSLLYDDCCLWSVVSLIVMIGVLFGMSSGVLFVICYLILPIDVC